MAGSPRGEKPPHRSSCALGWLLMSQSSIIRLPKTASRAIRGERLGHYFSALGKKLGLRSLRVFEILISTISKNGLLRRPLFLFHSRPHFCPSRCRARGFAPAPRPCGELAQSFLFLAGFSGADLRALRSRRLISPKPAKQK